MKSIKQIIIEQIESYDEFIGQPFDTSLDEHTVLIGNGGVLESVDFIGLILNIEKAVEAEYGKPVIISGEQAMSGFNNPFRTVGTLADYINKLLQTE